MNNKIIPINDNDKITSIEQYIPDEIKEESLIYENNRKAELKEHPKYLSIIKRLDELVFVGDLSDGVELFLTGDYTAAQLEDAIDDSFKYVKEHLEEHNKDKELFFNVSLELFDLIKYISVSIEMQNIDLTLWKYRRWLLCKAPELKGYMFNVYTLKPE